MEATRLMAQRFNYISMLLSRHDWNQLHASYEWDERGNTLYLFFRIPFVSLVICL
jgi:hypothetical protein